MGTYSLFSDLRHLLSYTPSYARWYELLVLLFRWPKDDDRQVACDYAMAHLDDWPDHIRVISLSLLQQLFGELSKSQQEQLRSEWTYDACSTTPGHPVWHLTRHLCWSGNPLISFDLFGPVDTTAFGEWDEYTQPFVTSGTLVLLRICQHITTLTIRNRGRARYEAPLSHAPFTDFAKLRSLTMAGFSVPTVGGGVVAEMTSLRSLQLFNCDIQKAFLGDDLARLDCIEIMESSIDLLEVSPDIKPGQLTLHNCFVRECHRDMIAPYTAHLGPQEVQQSAARSSRWGIRAERVLVSARGHRVGRHTDDARTTIGRDPDAFISISDSTLSRRHCEIRHDGEHFLIEDAQSTNGMCINGDFVREAHLNDGDRIVVGETNLQWRERCSFETGHRAPYLVTSTHVYPVAHLCETSLIPVSRDKFWMGRDRGNTLCINDGSISRRHCHIEREGDDYYLQDGQSSGGTFLNGHRVDLHPSSDLLGRVLLSHGDIIRCGSYAFVWEKLPTQETGGAGHAPVFQILEGENQGAFVEIPTAPCLLDLALRPNVEKYGTTASPRPRPRVFLVRYQRSYALQFEGCYGDFSVSYNDTNLTQHQLVMLHIGDIVSFYGIESCVWSIRWEGVPIARGCGRD